MRIEEALKNAASVPHPGPGVFMCSVLLAFFLQGSSKSARAEVQVTGGSNAITLEAKEASVEEVLTALKKAYGLQYGSSANLSRFISGTFAGSLQQVVSRVLVLQGYDFIAETSAQGTIVAVYGKSTAPVSTVAVAPQAAAAASGLTPARENEMAAALKRVRGPPVHRIASIWFCRKFFLWARKAWDDELVYPASA
jgi:hypothetical protein